MESPSTPQVATASRPVAVTVLGLVFLVFSALSIVSSLLAVAMMHFVSRVAPNGGFPPAPKDFPPGFSSVSWMFEYFEVLLLLQTVMAMFGVFAATRFLKLRAWSRTYFEVLNWIGLGWTVFFGIVFASGWVEMSSGVPAPTPGQGNPPADMFAAFGAFMAILVVLFNGAVPAGVIWLLRSRFVRPAFVRGAEGVGSSSNSSLGMRQGR